jgi:hypothetical protein
MTRFNPFGRGRKYEIINVLVDTFYLICNMPTLSDIRIVHCLTPPHPRRVPKVDGDFLFFNILACPALYYAMSPMKGGAGYSARKAPCDRKDEENIVT